MRAEKIVLLAGLCALAAGCAASGVVRMTAERQRAARPPVAALQAGEFEAAARAARAVLITDGHNPQAHLVAAVSGYQAILHALYRDMTSVLGGIMMGRTINHRLLADALRRAEAELAAVDVHLAAAARSPDIRLKLCLACWERDWDHDGSIGAGDRLLLQIERDAAGERIPEGDPRRKPTFQFDVGDVHWARAMVAFQRALFDLGLAYRLPEMAELRAADRSGTISIRLVEPKRITAARQRLFEGLEHADRARLAYLAETDDAGEWVPNPTQRDHPLPLPVDGQLYATWQGVLRDLGALLRSAEGIDVAEAAQLGDDQWDDPPQGAIDVGRLLARPGDIVIRLDHTSALDRDRTRQNAEAVLRDLFGDKYVARMKPSPLLQRLSRMKRELERGEESLERKLRYLFWLN